MLNLETTATSTAGYVINWIVGGIAITLFAEILVRLSRKQNSRTRFLAWFNALLGVVSLPIAGYVLGNSPVHIAGGMLRNVVLPVEWAICLFVTWALVACISLVRLGFGIAQIFGLRRRGVKLNLSSLCPELQQLQQACSGRKFTVYRCEDLRVPVAVGFIRPAVLLPSWTLQGLSTSELRAVLLHEIAHIQRWDDWTNLAHKILSAVFFFHPALWWIGNRLALEREMACDDLVVSENSNPRDYAKCLVSLAEKSVSRRGVELAQAAVRRVQHIRRRISQILDANHPGRIALGKPSLALILLFSAFSIVMSVRVPRLISFQDSGPAVRATASSSPPLQAKQELGVQWKRSAHAEGPSLLVNAALHSAKLKPVKLPKRSAVSQQSVLMANSEQKTTGSRLRVTQASADAPPDAAARQAYFLIIQTGYSQTGEAFWSLGLVQLTVFHPSGAQRHPEFFQKI